MRWRVRTITKSFWKRLVCMFSYWHTSHKWVQSICRSFKLDCHRTSQCQDRPESDNGGCSGWQWLQLDTKPSYLDLVQQIQRWSGMWAEDNDGWQIQGWLKASSRKKTPHIWHILQSRSYSVSPLVLVNCRFLSIWKVARFQYSFLSTTSQQSLLKIS